MARRACSERCTAGAAREATPDRSSGWREAKTVSVDFEDPRVERPRQSTFGPTAGGRLDQTDRRTGERSNDPRDLEPCRAETIKALVHEIFEIRRDRQLRTRVDSAAASLECTCELEGEEGIATRRLPDAQKRRSGKGCLDARAQQLVQRANAERRELDGLEPAGGYSLLKPRRSHTASGQDDHDRLALEARQRESQHRRGWLVEPLDVVDGEHEPVRGRHRGSQAAEGVEKRERDDAFVRRCTVGIREGEGGFERAPLRPWQLRQDLVDNAPDQVGQPDEGEVRLGLRGSAREHERTGRPRSLDCGQPQRRLADPGVADDHCGLEPISGRVKEIDESRKLVLPADQVPNADCHAFRRSLRSPVARLVNGEFS